MILFLRTFKLGIKSLMLHKLRSVLTTMGVLFGVASVIAMLAVGEGASQEAQRALRELGAANILLKTRKPPEDSSSNETKGLRSGNAYGLTYRDALAIGETLHSVKVVVPVRDVSKDIWYKDRKFSGHVLGTVPRFAEISGMRVVEGRWLSSLDLAHRANVVVLSLLAAEKLFPIEPPLGTQIKIGGASFTVVGVADVSGKGASGDSQNAVFTPLSTIRAWFGKQVVKSSAGSLEVEEVELHEIRIKIKTPEEVITTANVLRNILKKHHKQADYEVVVPLEMIKKAEEQKRMFNLVLVLIAGISLVVGGIGIMNVMLATVTERTREIGIRRALGAQRSHIVTQFLVETVTLSAGGGGLGVVVGIMIPRVITHFSGFETVVKPGFALLAFWISVFVGIMAGLYPAVRAANMSPVEALRHE